MFKVHSVSVSNSLVSQYAKHFPMKIILTAMLLSMCFATSTSTSTSTEQNAMKRCLRDGGVTNITGPQTWSQYDNLLKASLLHLRYYNSRVPKPALIVVPTTRAQVAVIIQCCLRHRWHLLIRSGGHSYEGLSSWSQVPGSFIILDLMQLDCISVDVAAGTVWAEAGATVGQLYLAISEASSEQGFPAGTCPTVGLGGHISGGGLGMMTRMYGISADHVVDAVVADGRGQLLDRDAMGEDVFWALRGGGGGSFGVVIAWKLRLVRVPLAVTVFDVRRSAVAADSNEADELLETVLAWQSFAPSTVAELTVRVQFLGNSTHRVARFYALYLGGKTQVLRLVKEGFPQLRLTAAECREMSFVESVRHFSEVPGVGVGVVGLRERHVDRYRNWKRGKSDLLKTPMPRQALHGLWNMVAQQDKSFISNVFMTPLGGAAMDGVSPSATPFPFRAGYMSLLHYMMITFRNDGGDGDGGVSEAVRSMYEYMTPYVSSNPRVAYVNYVDLDFGDAGGNGTASVEAAAAWGRRYFGLNYERLVAAKSQIDPTNVFRHAQSIPAVPPEETLDYCPLLPRYTATFPSVCRMR